MPAIAVNPPFPLFTDADGQPLDDAYIYIGTANQNPVSNPITVYWDEALTIAAAQPIRTSNGYPMRNGTPSRFYTNANYSILVRDKNGSFVYTAADENLFSSVDATFIQSGTGAVTRSVQDKLRESVSVKDFGAVGDGVTDDWAAVRAALDSNPKAVYFPPGTYYLSKTLNLKRTVKLYGDGAFDAAMQFPSILKFSDNIVGVFVHRSNTNASDTGVPVIVSPATTGADGSIIENLAVLRGTGTKVTPDGTSHGIWLKARALIRNVTVAGFAGNGVHIVADSVSAIAASIGNANNWSMENVRSINNYHGVFVNLGDANAGCGIHINSSDNQGWGIYDSSFLGNTYIGCHTASNTLGAYKTDDTNAQNVLIGCYSETPQASEFVYPTTLIGGVMQRAYISGTYYSLDSLPAFSGVTSSLFKDIALTSIVDGIAIQTIQNSNSLTSSRHAGYRVRVGTVGGSETNVGMFYGRGSSSNTTDKHSAGIAVYNGTSGLYEKGIEVFGLLNQIIPGADNAWSMGSSGLRWSVVYAATGTINTSDAREKQQIKELSESERAVAKRLKGLIRSFRWNDAVERKGDKARIHVGVIAQDVMAAFESEGLNASNYGVLCFDSWPDEFDEDGNKTREAGNRYGVRYDQLFAFVIAGL